MTSLSAVLVLLPVALVSAASPSAPTALEVIQRHAKATGLPSAWGEITSLCLTYRVEVDGKDGGTVQEVLCPAPYRVSRAVRQGERLVDMITQDGRTAVRVTQKEKPSAWFEMPFTPIDHDPRWHQELGWHFERLADEVVEGRRCHVLRRVCPEANLSWFDAETGLLVRRREGSHQIIRSYREIGEVKVPEVIDIDEFGRLRRLTLVSVERNPSLEGKVTAFPDLPKGKGPSSEAGKVLGEDDAVPETLRVQTLEAAWKLVNDRFYDPTFQGVDWAAVKERYLPQAKAAATVRELHGVVGRMLAEIKASHMMVLPAGFTTTNSGGGALGGTLGLRARMEGDRVWVTGFTEPAAQQTAGAPKPGEEIVALEGVPVKERLQRIRAAGAPGSPTTPSALLRKLGLVGFLKRAEDPALGKPLGATLTLRLRDGRGREREVPMPVLRARGEERPFEVSWQGEVAVLQVRGFTGSFLLELKEALPRLRKAKGVILDLRGNGGGFDGQARCLGGCFLDKEVVFMKAQSRQGSESRAMKPWGGEAVLAPLVVLVDAQSGSTSELLAAALQECGRAKVVGQRSAGAVLSSMVSTLPTGARIQIAVGDSWTAKGRRLEGEGVKPDVEAREEGGSLDASLEAALKLFS